MHYYVQLLGDICVAVTQTSGPLVGPEFIELTDFDPSLCGQRHVGGGVFEPVPVVLPRHISRGAFYDRFGPAKWDILADQTPSVVAVVADASVRTYIDLDNPQLPAGLAIIAAAGHDIDADEIIGAPVRPEERP
ncbi:MAG TPA: hypothetical protein VMS38_12655 [Pseudorhodoferax sp.]|nr:hypothetical protein [Pseudorhodoferax sp.]